MMPVRCMKDRIRVQEAQRLQTGRAGGHLAQVCLIPPGSITIDNLVPDLVNVHKELPVPLSHWSNLHSGMYLGFVQQG